MLFAVVCFAENEVKPKSAEHYKKEGVVIVAPVQWRPFAFLSQDGNYVGYAVDFWDKWSSKTGVAVKYVHKDWPDTLQTMKNGEADIHIGLYYTDERAEYMEFSDSLYSATSVLAIRDDSPVDCSNALSHGLVGVVKDSYTAKYVATNYPEAKTKPYLNSKDISLAFLNGEVDAVVTAYPPFVLQVREQEAMNRLTICRTVFYREAYAGVQKGQTELLKLVNAGVAEMTPSELNNMEAKWFAPSEDPELRWLPAILPAVMAFLFVVAAVMYWVGARRRRK